MLLFLLMLIKRTVLPLVSFAQFLTCTDVYEIECPRCRRVTPLSAGAGVESLSKNYDLDQVVQAMPPQPPEPQQLYVRQLSGTYSACQLAGKKLN